MNEPVVHNFVSSSIELGGHAQTAAKILEIIIDAGSREGLGGFNRYFHNTEHFRSLEGGTAISTLVAWFHDVVQWNVDTFLHSQVGERIIGRFIDANDRDFVVKKPEEGDKMAQALQIIFNVKPEQKLTNGDNCIKGANEFMSAAFAIAAMKEMGITEPETILEVVLSIAGTIPFTPADYFDVLAKRLYLALKLFESEFKLVEEQIDGILYRALDFANRDVGGMTNQKEFTEGTLNLIRERVGADNLEDKAVCQEKVEEAIKFYNELAEGVESGDVAIIHKYKIAPGKTEMDLLDIRVRRNLERIGNYLQNLASAIKNAPEDGFAFDKVVDQVPKPEVTVDEFPPTIKQLFGRS